MGIIDMFSKDDPDTINTYGYKYRVTDLHMSPEQLAPLKFKYDVVGTEAMAALDEISPPPPPRAGWRTTSKEENPQADRDTYALLRDNFEKDPKAKALWDEINTVPEWVDWEQIKRGQEVFYRYAPGAIAGFAFQGLLASTGSSYRPAETLVRTGGHSVKVAKKRLFETFQFLLQVTKDLEAVQPGGNGFASAVRVRLLHATVRNRILKLKSQRPSYFDVDKFGVPISEVDSMQSLCAFSTNLVWLALPRQGIYVKHQEALDYIALWRWIGYVLGTPHHVLETPEKAAAIMDSMLNDCMRPTENSRVLAQNLVKALDGVSPLFVQKEFFEAGTRFINGDELCDDIGLGKPGLYWKMVVLGQTWALALITYLSRSIPAWDRWQVNMFRNFFWSYIVEGKDGLGGEYAYEFKYQPHLDEKTGTKTETGADQKIYGGALEKLGFYAFMFFVAIFTIVGTFVIRQIPGIAAPSPHLAINLASMKR